jgi:hypothetical protein
MVVSAAQGADPLDQLAPAMDVYLGALARAPMWARAFLIEVNSAGPAARRRMREVNGWYAELLRQWRGAAAPLVRSPAPPRAVYAACVAAVNELVVRELERSTRPRLLAPQGPALYIQHNLLGVDPD